MAYGVASDDGIPHEEIWMVGRPEDSNVAGYGDGGGSTNLLVRSASWIRLARTMHVGVDGLKA